MIRSLRGRVVLSLTLVTIGVLGAFVAVVFFLFRDRLRSELDQSLTSYSADVVAAARAGRGIPQPPIEEGQLGAALLAPDGKVLDSTIAFEGELTEEGEEEPGEDEGESGEIGGHSTAATLLETASTEGAFLNLPGEHGTQLRAFVRTIQISGVRVAVATMAPASSSGSPVNRLLVISLVALISAVVVVVAIAYWVGGVATRPLGRLASEVHSLDESTLNERVDVPTRAAEVAEVAAAINVLLERIEKSLQRERDFVADASHELRNPLASLRAELELSVRGGDPDRMQAGIAGAIEETDRLAALADDLLLMARAEAGGLPEESISLADVASTAVIRSSKKADDAGISLRLTGDDTLVLGSSALAERSLENLIENALRYAPRDSEVRVSLWSEGSAAGVDVHDRGPGISVQDRDRIFDRFSRVDAARARGRGGSGLGLAIVHSAMRTMDGSVQLISSDPGDTRFRLTFRRAGSS